MGAREAAAASAKRRHPDVEAYVAKVPLPARLLAADLRALVKRAAKDARENLCYGVPFFFVGPQRGSAESGSSRQGRSGGVAFCYVSPAKTHVTFGSTMGASLDDPASTTRAS